MKLLLDSAQYYVDCQNQEEEEIYSSFNLIMRRKAKVGCMCAFFHQGRSCY